MLIIHLIWKHPVRAILTIAGIAFCAVLIIFLWSVYLGVSHGALDYIRKNNADIWVVQNTADNIIRGTSFLSSNMYSELKAIPGVESVSSILILLTSIEKGNNKLTTYLVGYNPSSPFGGPPMIARGRTVSEKDDIVLDRAFAVKNKIDLGDEVVAQNKIFKVKGISTETNAFVIQYSFVTLEAAQELIPFPGLLSAFLIKLDKTHDPKSVVKIINESHPQSIAYSFIEFLANNVKEMKTGLLPLLLTIAVFGATVLGIILSLILTITIMGQKNDFAVMMIIGSPSRFITFLVIKQSLFFTTLGGIIGLVLYFPVARLVETLSPEIATRTGPLQLILIFILLELIGLASSLFSLAQVRKIYPMEIFNSRI